MGLTALAVLSAGTLTQQIPAIEADIAARARAALAADPGVSGLVPWPLVEAVGRDLRIRGAAPADAAIAAAIERAATTTGVRTAAGSASLLPEASPFRLSVSRNESGWRLAGMVGSLAVRDALRAQAAKLAGNATVDDALAYARNLPPGAEAAGAWLIAQVGRLVSGEGAIEGQTLSLRGAAADPAAYAALRAAAAAPPPGFTVDAAAVAPPLVADYRLGMGKTRGALALDGFVPSEAARSALLARLKQLDPTLAVTDNLAVAAGAPADFDRLAAFAAEQAVRLAVGTATLNGARLALEGRAADGFRFESVLDAVAAPPQGLTIARLDVTPWVASPYRVTLVRDGNLVALSGFVPSRETRAAWRRTIEAALPGVTFADRTQIALGAPVGLDAALATAAESLAHLRNGVAELLDRNLSIAGQARDAAAEAALKAVLTRLPQGFVPVAVAAPPPAHTPPPAPATPAPAPAIPAPAPAVAAPAAPSAPVAAAPAAPQAAPILPPPGLSAPAAIALPPPPPRLAPPDLPPPPPLRVPVPVMQPYLWSARRENGRLQLEGGVPSNDLREALVAAARALPGAPQVEDRMTLALGAPNGLAQMARAALRHLQHVESGAARITDGAYAFAGRVADARAWDALQADLRRLPTGFALAERPAVSLPVVAPYRWRAELDAANRLVISGYFPDHSAQEAVLATAREALSGRRLVDETRIAPGAPAGLAEALHPLLRQLAWLVSGAATLDGDTLSISGRSADHRINATSIRGELQAALRAPYKLGTVDIVAPPKPPEPYVWSIRRDGTGIVIDGFVPDEAARAEILGMVRARFAALNIIDRMMLTPDPPEDFVKTVAIAVSNVAELLSGEASIRWPRLRVSGLASTEKVALGVRSAVVGTSVVRGDALIAVKVELPPAEEAACGTSLAGLAGSASVRFDKNRAEIKDEYRAAIDRVIALARKCPNSRFAVEGHADSDGPHEFNQHISQERARAVVAELVGAGIAETRLSPLGFAESRPVAPNRSSAEKALNRRVDFVVMN
jgi:outer membrane protein OmpA-like peptidoglycan-associated protein/osmotically-inducible protein OsmY